MDRAFRVRGGNVVSLSAKEILEDRLYVCGADGPEMAVDGQADRIPRGAILWCSRKHGSDGLPFTRSFDDGLYVASHVIGTHVDDAYAREIADGVAPARAVEIERIRRSVGRQAQALRTFAERLFDELRQGALRLRDLARVWRASAAVPPAEAIDAIVAKLEGASRFLRGVCVAPLSRRALPNAADDVDAAIAHARDRKLADAAARLSMAERSLRMTFARRSLELPFSIVTRHQDRGTVPDNAEREFLAGSIVRVLGTLFEGGKALDFGFRAVRIVPTVVPKLSAVIDHLRSNNAYDAAGTYDHFRVACATL